jgi:hypothetical protein
MDKQQIGLDGKVLPNDVNYIYQRTTRGTRDADDVVHTVECGNVAAKVLNAILACSDLFFEVKRDDWSIDQVEELVEKCRRMHAALLVVWELKNALMTTKAAEEGTTANDAETTTAREIKETILKMRKMHNFYHLPFFASLIGCLSKLDTNTWERAHKYFTSGNLQRMNKIK